MRTAWHRVSVKGKDLLLTHALSRCRPGYGYGFLDVRDRPGALVATRALYPPWHRLESWGLLTSLDLSPGGRG